jgi:hypothetical protein
MQFHFPNQETVLISTNLGAPPLKGVRKSSGWQLTKWNVYQDDHSGWSGYNPKDIARYYEVSGPPAGARFIIFKDGRSEYTVFGSGRPILSQIAGPIFKSF